ncbi:MAG: DUF3365 domain-containing protein [Candidatus Sedimenticola endophacoides]
MTSKHNIHLLYLLLAFIVAFLILFSQFRTYTEDYAIREAEKLVQDALLTHRAIHKYVTKVSRPELYRLKEEGKLYQEYFAPETMSFTFQARGIKDYLNEERRAAGMPEIYFKLASNNSRNKINRADPKESELLERMNRGELTKYRELQQDADGAPSLYVAMATDPVAEGCLACHGDPEDAPREMVARYPRAEDYYEKEGDIRALISIRIPLADHLEDARRIANILIFITVV